MKGPDDVRVDVYGYKKVGKELEVKVLPFLRSTKFSKYTVFWELRFHQIAFMSINQTL